MIRRRIEPDLAKSAAEQARKKIQDLDRAASSVLACSTFPEITWDDVEVGELLGEGGFNDVNEVILKKARDTDSSEEQEYAIKYLRHGIMSRKETFDAGAKDLVVEYKMLSQLQHENMIRLHATGSMEASYLNGLPYFLILDRLYGTLEEQIRKWRWQDDHVVKQQSSVVKKLRGNLSDAQKRRLYERLDTVSVPVARAMAYLHRKNVLFRDLKPGNVGLTSEGGVKLFDFGLARLVKPTDKLLTANTGSPLYMAPEVALGGHYGLSADVFSFAMFLWEVGSLKIPFDGMTAQEHYEHAVEGNLRPKVDAKSGSILIQKMIQQAWDRDPEVRPTFDEIVPQLREEVTRKQRKFGYGGSKDEKTTSSERSRSGRQ